MHGDYGAREVARVTDTCGIVDDIRPVQPVVFGKEVVKASWTAAAQGENGHIGGRWHVDGPREGDLEVLGDGGKPLGQLKRIFSGPALVPGLGSINDYPHAATLR